MGSVLNSVQQPSKRIVTGEDYAKSLPSAGSVLNKILGFPTEQDFQGFKRQADYEQKLWRERADYESYAAQMERMRAAGLNPDLVVDKGVQQGAPNAVSTPYYPNQSSVPAMINSLTNASLAESQIRKNIADADRAQAETDNTKTQTSFMSETFGLRRDMLSEQLGLKQDERKLFQQQTEMFSAYAEQAMAQVRYLSQLAQTETWNTEKTYQETRSAASSADMMRKRNLMFPQFQEAELLKLKSEINLNDATKRNIQQETRFLLSSFDMRLQLLSSQRSLNVAQSRYYRRQGLLGESMANYYNTFDRFLGVQMEYYPFQIMGHLINDPLFFQTDKDGKIVVDEKGMPKIRHGYQVTKIAMDISNDAVGLIKDGASAYGSIAFPSAVRGASKGFQAGEAVKPNQSFSVPKSKGFKKERNPTPKEDEMFSSWYREAGRDQEKQRNVSNRIIEYKRKHGIY